MSLFKDIVVNGLYDTRLCECKVSYESFIAMLVWSIFLFT